MAAQGIYLKHMVNSADVVNTLGEWGIACLSFPTIGYEAKDFVSRDWADENGEDVYIPSQINVKATDIDIELAHKGGAGSSAMAISNILAYLTDSQGAGLMIYDAYSGASYKGVYFKKLSEIKWSKSNIDEVTTFKLTLRIPNPLLRPACIWRGDVLANMV